MTDQLVKYQDLEDNVLTLDILRQTLRHDSNCIDIGASNGVILRQMLELSPKGKHFAFEPIPQNAQILREQFKTVSIFELALSDKKGTADFCFVKSNPGYSGLRQRTFDREEEKTEILTVTTDSLDNIIPQNTRIDLIKIDVEGAEFQVLRGAINTLSLQKPLIIFEHGLGAADIYGTTPEMVFDFFFSIGYKLFLLKDWLATEPELTRANFCQEFYQNTNWYFVADAR